MCCSQDASLGDLYAAIYCKRSALKFVGDSPLSVPGWSGGYSGLTQSLKTLWQQHFYFYLKKKDFNINYIQYCKRLLISHSLYYLIRIARIHSRRDHIFNYHFSSVNVKIVMNYYVFKSRGRTIYHTTLNTI